MCASCHRRNSRQALIEDPQRRSTRSARSLRPSRGTRREAATPVSDVASATAPRHRRTAKSPCNRQARAGNDRIGTRLQIQRFGGAGWQGPDPRPTETDVHQAGEIALVARLAVSLGGVHRQVGVAEDVLGSLGAVGVSDADARGERHGDRRARRQRDGLGKHREHTVGDLGRRWPRRASESRIHLGSSTNANSSPPKRATMSPSRDTRAQTLPDDPEHGIARRVAVTVVDGFEAIEVEHAGPRRDAALPTAGSRLRCRWSTEHGRGWADRSAHRGTLGGSAAGRV